MIAAANKLVQWCLATVLGLSLLSCISVAPLPTSCQTDRDCTTPGFRCDTQSKVCRRIASSGCQNDRDCGANRVCTKSLSSGLCMDRCQLDVDCAEGNICSSAGVCVCDENTCLRRTDGVDWLCHPLTRQCEPVCQADSDCDTGDTCFQSAAGRYCFPTVLAVSQCDADADCQAVHPLAMCDVGVTPRVCVVLRLCQTDKECANYPLRRFCHPTSLRCVECRDSSDCAGSTCLGSGLCK